MIKKSEYLTLFLNFFYTPMRSYKKEKENSKVFKFLSETAFNQVWIDFASKVTEGKKNTCFAKNSLQKFNI